MGLFNLDIDRLYDELRSKEKRIKGIFCLQYPVYCIHADITDITSDPLDNLDRAIADFFVAKPNFKAYQIAALMGTSKSLVELRILKMMRDGLLYGEGGSYILTEIGVEVLRTRDQIRQHKRAYDFYLDGITLAPLSKPFYTQYSSRFISENDAYYHTNSKGETRLIRPFGPDLVHTPPSEDEIVKNILSVEHKYRDSFSIPNGLQEINEISFTKLSLQLLIVCYEDGETIKKEVIDGYAVYSLSESYYKTVRKNIESFEKNIQDKIENLEFKIHKSKPKLGEEGSERLFLTSNWPEIGRFRETGNKCFSFSTEDLVKLIEQNYQITQISEDNLVNSETEISISVTKEMLLDSSNRRKIINDLVRERDYKFGNQDNNIFLLYLYYKTSDSFVQQILTLRKFIDNIDHSSASLAWDEKIKQHFGQNYRQLLIAAGEFDLLEKLDIKTYMEKIQ